MDSTSYRLSGFTSVTSSYIDSLALNPKYHSLATFLKKLKSVDPQLRIDQQQSIKLEALLKAVCESVSAMNDRNFSVTYDAFIKFYKTVNLSHNLLHRYYKNLMTSIEDENKKLHDEVDPLKEKSLQIDSLNQQVEELKNKLAESQKKEKSASSSAKRHVCRDVAKSLKIKSKPSDASSLVKAIKSMNKKNLGHVNEIVKEFNLPQNTTKSNLLEELKRVTEAQTNEQNDTISNQAQEISKLKRIVAELKEQLLAENDFSPEDDKKKLQKTIIQQKRQINKLETELNKKTTSKTEMNNLLKLYDDLTEQYRSQSNEMISAINSRTELILAVEKQNQIIAYLENIIESDKENGSNNNLNMSPAINPTERRKNLSYMSPAAKRNSEELEQLENDLNKIISEIPIEKDEIVNVLESSDPIAEKVKMAVSKLIDYSFTNNELLSTNQKLFSVIVGQFKFINDLANSKKSFSALYPDSTYEECRNLLIAQVGRIQNFISTNAKGLAEDSCLFEDLLKTQNSQNFLENVKKYLGNYAKPQSLESEELFILLLQSVACNDILRQYSDEACKHNTVLAQKYKQLRDYSEQAKKALEIQSTSMVQESNSKMQETINAAKTLLRKSLIQDTSQNPDIIDHLEELDNVAPIKDTEYIRALQKQNGDLRKELFEIKNSNTKLLSDTKNDLETVLKQMSQVKDESNKKLAKKTDENKKLSNKLKQVIGRLAELKKENISLTRNLENADQKYKEYEEQSNAIVSEIQEQLSTTRSDFQALLKETQTRSEEWQMSSSIEIKKMKGKIEKENIELKKENKKLKRALKKEKGISEEMSSKYDEICSKYEEKIEKLRNNENEALDAADTVSRQFKEIHNDYQKLQLEYKALKSRFDSKDEAAKRDLSILENQLSAKIMAIEHDAQTMVEAVKSAQNSKTQYILGEICKYFPGYVNIQTPISEETVFSMLAKMRETLKKYTDNSKNMKILEEVAKLLHVDDYSLIPSTITDLLEDIESKIPLLDSLDVANASLDQYKEWLQRMYSLITKGLIDNPSMVTMQKSIEDALLSSLGSNAVFQRLETLKAEKILLLMKAQDVELPKKAKLSIRHLMIMIMYIMRMKKLSGHMDNKYSFAVNFHKDDSDNSNGDDKEIMFGESPFSNLVFFE